MCFNHDTESAKKTILCFFPGRSEMNCFVQLQISSYAKYQMSSFAKYQFQIERRTKASLISILQVHFFY